MTAYTARAAMLLGLALLPETVFGQDAPKEPGIIPTTDVVKREDDPEKVVTTLELLAVLSAIALAPAAGMILTSFTRIVIVLSFVRRAISTQELPPNQVIAGLALVITILVMSPTLAAIKRDALDPYVSKDPATKISQQAALERAVGHLREFMFKFARDRDVALFMDLTRQPRKEGGWAKEDVPTEVLVPAFAISELRRAFLMGLAVLLPFLVIDLVVAAALVSMGMFMLPPVLISLPFKILLFVLIDGWTLVVGSLLQSFAGP